MRYKIYLETQTERKKTRFRKAIHFIEMIIERDYKEEIKKEESKPNSWGILKNNV